MRWSVAAGVVAAVVVAGGAAYLVRGLAPSQEALAEGKAFTTAHNLMMRDMGGSLSGNADVDFARLMIPHHQGALDMADVEINYGKDQTVLALARRMSAAQQPEIDRLTAWQKAHSAPASIATNAATAAYGAASDKMMNGMMGDSMAHSGNADRDFVKIMIPHHQGAIDVANVELKYGSDPDLKALAQTVVTAQQAEIDEMTTWLTANGD